MSHRSNESSTELLPPEADSPQVPGHDTSAADEASEKLLDVASPERGNDGQLRSPGTLAGAGRIIMETGPVALPLRGVAKAFQALFEHRDYRLVWVGALFSNMGMWIQTVAMQWLIKDLAPTNTSALWLGRAAFCQQTVTMFLLPLGGVLADRFDRRHILLAGNVFLALLSISVSQLEASGNTRVVHLVIMATVLGFWQSMLIPASQSLLPTLVSRQNLPNSVALNAMQFNLSRAIGPAVGGKALVAFGAAWSFGINAFAYLFIITAVLMIKTPTAKAPRHEGVLKAFVGGARYLKTRRDLQVIMFTVFCFGMLAVPIMFMLPAIIEQMFDNQQTQYSTLLSCFGIGAVVGATMLAARSRKRASPWRALLTMGCFGLLQFLLSMQSNFHVAMVVLLLCGSSFTGSLNRLFAATIGSVPSHVGGRIASFHVMSLMSGFAIGSITAGKLATLWGIQSVLCLYGLTMTAILLVTGSYIFTTRLTLTDDTDEDDVVKS